MAVISSVQIPAVDASSYANQTQSSNASRATASTQQPAATLKDDTVKLSLAAHIKQMHLQGYSPAIIASQLGISVKQVATYLPGLAQAAAAASASSANSPVHNQPMAPIPARGSGAK